MPGAFNARRCPVIRENTCIKLVPARVCADCGHPLTRELVSPEQQSAGLCLLCRTLDDKPQVHESAKPIWPLVFFLSFAFWTAVIIVALFS